MFSKMRIIKSTRNCLDDTERIKHALESADVVIIGAGAGLSTAAGFAYDGENFTQNFADFEEKYGFHDMYSGGFYPYETAQEHWAYWSRYILLNRFRDVPKNTYQTLLTLVKSKNYFVLTTNVDHCFQKAGFDKQRLFYTQGDYGLFQCSRPCCQETFDNEEAINKMVMEQKDMRVPTDLLPRCPKCGRPFTMNLRSDDKFVQDEGWYAASSRYEDFLRRHQNGHVLYLELGVGYNTPVIIKYPFWRMTYANPNATYVCINLGEAVAPKEIEKRSICLNSDVGTILQELK